ncbi:two-component system QseEF-associated lipoprotein QseG [Brenneria izbisi]|uniref:Two-component system QseEF-associated lipoprotein QseG n=1 Tax=Brenneria izbisi TaxID=2939450 RepID=A0AA41XYT4_9GAMM|nr:two-component system QseEF-associated lipoprotein QseG [Brenneria izbisi]MCV9880114.1 two-component system QseEF-associated lipoprotein QseG [Brenneria izbisi]MCV9883503.1 two-component system QseEF-associated lipoprotein QseG [Brenneria izbisi]
MNAWFARPCPQRILSVVSSRRVLKAVVVLSPLLLAACNSHVNRGISLLDKDSPTPKEQVTDYRIAQCERLWQVDDREAMNNALYWLRAMDCAGRLTPFQAREEALRLEEGRWENAFKQGILLDNAGITQTERHQMLEQLNLYRLDFPSSLRSLVKTWRDRQTLLLALSDERLRYKRLQESSDKQLDTLRIQQNHLQYQLETTTRKLENLTDIERQLSSRKQLSGELPGNDVEYRSNLGINRKTRGAAQNSTVTPTKAEDTYSPPVEPESTNKEPNTP